MTTDTWCVVAKAGYVHESRLTEAQALARASMYDEECPGDAPCRAIDIAPILAALGAAGKGATLVCFASSFAYESAPNITHVTMNGQTTLCGRSGWATEEEPFNEDEEHSLGCLRCVAIYQKTKRSKPAGPVADSKSKP